MSYQLVNDVLKVEEAFIQEEVPGSQGKAPKHYLNIRFSEQWGDNSMIDSIRFDNTSIPSLTSITLNRQMMIKEEIPALAKDNMGKLIKPLVTIYFKEGKKGFRQVVAPLLVKEPIYLP